LASKRPEGPCCIVLDVRLPGLSGLDFQQELARKDIPIPIIFITGHGDIPMSVRAMKAGAVEFLTKPLRDQDLLDATQAALRRDRARLDDERKFADLRTRHETLTTRERQVMALLVSGRVNKQIAAEIGISEVTVRLHRGQIMRKMRASSLADLIRIADKIKL
jgi:FixJ family two-component response regulator